MKLTTKIESILAEDALYFIAVISSICYRGHGTAVSLPLIAVRTRHCRVLAVGNINSDANEFEINH